MPKTSRSTLTIAARREKVLRLRTQNLTIRQIAEAIAPEVGRLLSPSVIHKDISTELDRLHALTTLKAKQLQTMELERLDMLARSLGNSIASGDIQAATLYLKICESRRKLLGLDAPVQLQVQQQLETQQDQLINLLESALDAETFAKVTAAATAIAEASAAAERN